MCTVIGNVPLVLNKYKEMNCKDDKCNDKKNYKY